MKSSFVPLAQLFSITKRIEGRKRCQKIVHILQVCGADFDLQFELALYGAYSSALQLQLEDLVEYRFLSETRGEAKENPVSVFTIEEKFKKALKKLKEPAKPDWANLATKLNDQSTRKLEATSTVMFLRSRGLDGNALKEKFCAIKPRLKTDFKASLEFATELCPPA